MDGLGSKWTVHGIQQDGPQKSNWTVQKTQSRRSVRVIHFGTLRPFFFILLGRLLSLLKVCRSTLTFLDRPLWYLWTVYVYPLIHSDRPLRPMTVNFVSVDRPVWLRDVHIHPFGPSTLDLTSKSWFELSFRCLILLFENFYPEPGNIFEFIKMRKELTQRISHTFMH